MYGLIGVWEGERRKREGGGEREREEERGGKLKGEEERERRGWERFKSWKLG